MSENFGDHISWLVKRVGSIRRLLPSFAAANSMLAREARKNYDSFLEQTAIEKKLNDRGQIDTYVLPADQLGKHRRIIRTLDDSHVFLDLLPKMAIIALVGVYDSYLGRLVRSLYAAKPEALNASNRQFTYSQLVAFDSLNDAREYILEKEVESLLRESHIAQFEWLETKVGIPLRKELSAWPTFVELTERRNLFVHTDGVVGSQYLTICDQQKVPLESSTKQGVSVGVTRQYFLQACDCITEIGVKLGQVMWRKLLPEELEDADSQLNQACYELLTFGEYSLAVILGEFACLVLPRHSSAESKLVFQINLAQSYKWAERSEDCTKILDSIDWSPLSDKFQLAAMVLREDYDAAAQIMRRIGQSGHVPKAAYQDWPLFRLFRTQDVFQAAYREIFGEPFRLRRSRQADRELNGTTHVQDEAGSA